MRKPPYRKREEGVSDYFCKLQYAHPFRACRRTSFSGYLASTWTQPHLHSTASVAESASQQPLLSGWRVALHCVHQSCSSGRPPSAIGKTATKVLRVCACFRDPEAGLVRLAGKIDSIFGLAIPFNSLTFYRAIPWSGAEIITRQTIKSVFVVPSQ